MEVLPSHPDGDKVLPPGDREVPGQSTGVLPYLGSSHSAPQLPNVLMWVGSRLNREGASQFGEALAEPTDAQDPFQPQCPYTIHFPIDETWSRAWVKPKPRVSPKRTFAHVFYVPWLSAGGGQGYVAPDWKGVP